MSQGRMLLSLLTLRVFHKDPLLLWDDGCLLPNCFYPVRNNAPLLPPGQRPSGPAAAAGLDFRLIPARFNALLEFLTGLTFS